MDTQRGGDRLDLACFSYLAATQVLRITHYPAPNGGAEIESVEEAVNGDGPLVAAFASGLGLRVALETNAVGRDPPGDRLREFLARNGVVAELVEAPATPLAIVLAQPDGAREWFVEFGPIRQSLAGVGDRVLGRAALAYVDCYASLADEAARALEAAARAGVPVYANIGGQWPPPQPLRDALERNRPAVAQDNLDEATARETVAHARDLREQLGAELALVTAGADGAVAVTADGEERAPARAVEVDHTNGAGAAFTAAAIYGRRAAWPLSRTLELACAAGSLQCTSARREAPSVADLEEFLRTTRPRR